MAFCFSHFRVYTQGQESNTSEPTQWTPTPWEKKASPSTHVSYSVLQATCRFYPSFPVHSRGWKKPTIWQQPSSRHRRVLLGAEQIGQQSSQQRIKIWGPPDSTRKQLFPGWPSVFLGCPHPHGSHPILPYLKDSVGVVIGLYVIQAHNTWQVSGAIICPGQLGLLVQVSDLLLCEIGLQHILQNKRKFQVVLGQSIELTGHICNSNFFQKQKILCHEQPPKVFPTVGLRMEVTWNGPTAHCSSINRWLSKTQITESQAFPQRACLANPITNNSEKLQDTQVCRWQESEFQVGAHTGSARGPVHKQECRSPSLWRSEMLWLPATGGAGSDPSQS